MQGYQTTIMTIAMATMLLLTIPMTSRRVITMANDHKKDQLDDHQDDQQDDQLGDKQEKNFQSQVPLNVGHDQYKREIVTRGKCKTLSIKNRYEIY